MISEASVFLLLRIFPIPSKHSIKMKQECDIHLQFVKLGYKSKVPWADSDGEESVSGPAYSTHSKWGGDIILSDDIISPCVEEWHHPLGM